RLRSAVDEDRLSEVRGRRILSFSLRPGPILARALGPADQRSGRLTGVHHRRIGHVVHHDGWPRPCTSLNATLPLQGKSRARPSVRRVRQIELPVQEVRGLIEDLDAVLDVRYVPGSGPG